MMMMRSVLVLMSHRLSGSGLDYCRIRDIAAKRPRIAYFFVSSVSAAVRGPICGSAESGDDAKSPVSM